MPKTTLDQVREFHETYGLSIKNEPDVSDLRTNDLRISLLAEELEELKEALAQGDTLETLDALIDLQYVLDGAFLSLGLHGVKEAAFNEVHRSNMSKLGEDGKPVVRESDGKILKGPHYFKPDLMQFIPADQKTRAA
ncbi:MAG: nucleoside triphosphate pyrophosphohydrolase family protein [Alphaproteobacteria bacterium]|nr:nucleoside triphosphate pyrophosphohydrolase family protein [Alphaproteobacteria bacterium]